MPIIRFTDSDRLASTIVPTEWYPAEIMEIEGPKKSSTEKSFNFFFKLQLLGDKYPGKELQIVFNTGMRSPSILGSMQLYPHAWIISLAAAVLNLTPDQVPGDFDTDTLLRKPFDLKVEKGIQDGVPMNTVLTWLPAGKSTEASKTPF